jgi:hypothetical protein
MYYLLFFSSFYPLHLVSARLIRRSNKHILFTAHVRANYLTCTVSTMFLPSDSARWTGQCPAMVSNRSVCSGLKSPLNVSSRVNLSVCDHADSSLGNTLHDLTRALRALPSFCEGSIFWCVTLQVTLERGIFFRSAYMRHVMVVQDPRAPIRYSYLRCINT